jgi:halocyanin-like protein
MRAPAATDDHPSRRGNANRVPARYSVGLYKISPEVQTIMDRRDFMRSAGGLAGGTAAVAAAGPAAAQEEGGGGGTERPVWSDYVSDARDQGYEDLRGQSEVAVEVGAGSDGLSFAPTFVWVDPGTDVTWEWTGEGGSHNVVAQSGADFRSGDPVSDAGTTFSHTFEDAGMVDYYCSPHENLGMKGAIAVGDDVETETIGGGGGGGPDVPDAAKSLGIAAGFAMAATLGLAYVFLKYGGNYGEADAA